MFCRRGFGNHYRSFTLFFFTKKASAINANTNIATAGIPLDDATNLFQVRLFHSGEEWFARVVPRL